VKRSARRRKKRPEKRRTRRTRRMSCFLTSDEDRIEPGKTSWRKNDV